MQHRDMSKKDPRKITLVWLDAETARALRLCYPRGPMADRIRRAVHAGQGAEATPIAPEVGPFRVQLPPDLRGLDGAQIAGLAAAGLQRG